MANRVLIIQHKDIVNLNIPSGTCLQWIEESFKMKYEAQLQPKISVHPQGDDFFNSMPCLLPSSLKRFAIKEVRRIAGQEPVLASDILLYNSQNGKLLSIIDGDWITTMRTGAVAALAIRTFKKRDVHTYSFIGLGNTARATALCLLSEHKEAPVHFRLLHYKDQAEDFVQRFQAYPNLTCEIVDTIDELVGGADVLISCLTSASSLLCPNDSLFRKGVVVIPVHTRGFQNCDLFFDKVYGDDTGHIKEFKYFSQFRQFAEFSEVLLGRNPGREHEDERILCYNIGLGLHDALFASKIYDIMQSKSCQSFSQEKETRKFWI